MRLSRALTNTSDHQCDWLDIVVRLPCWLAPGRQNASLNRTSEGRSNCWTMIGLAIQAVVVILTSLRSVQHDDLLVFSLTTDLLKFSTIDAKGRVAFS